MAPIDDLQAALLEKERDPAEALSLAADQQFVVLGIGRSRMAIPQGPKLVAKLAWRPLGLAENAVEQRVFDRAAPELAAVLAPALGLRESGILIQGRCHPALINQESAPVIATLASHGIVDGVLNLGRYEQRLVCYDYALLGPERFLELTAD